MSESPFIPGTNVQFAWDSTSLGMIKTCPRLYQYTMIEGWSTKDEKIDLRFGIEYHSSMQEYERIRVESPDLSHDEILNITIHNLILRVHDWNVDESRKPGKYKNKYSIVQVVIDYLDLMKDSPIETYRLADGSAAVELSFRVELPFGPDKFEGQNYILCGHLDRVVKFGDELFVEDYKTTTTTLSDYYFNQYEPNNQMTLYTFAGQAVLHTTIKGVMVSAAQLKLTEPNAFARKQTLRTDDQLNEWIEDTSVHLALAENFARIDYWPQNDTACNKYGGCAFREVCSTSPDNRQRFLDAGFIKLSEDEKWNPLKSR